MSDEADLRAFFAAPAFARPLARVRDALRRAEPDRLGSIVTADLAEPELDALGRILGRRPAGQRLALGRLDEGLRATRFELGLREVVEVLDGAPLASRPAERRALAEARAAYLASARAHPVVAAAPALSGWLDELVRLGILRRVADGTAAEARLLARALDVLAVLDPPRSLARLAADACGGDAHALDEKTTLSKIVLRAVAHLSGLAFGGDAESRRSLWGAVHVETDALSSRVLTLGLYPPGDGLAAAIRGFTDEGEAVHLSLRTVAAHPEFGAGAATVFVCENPSVVEAALAAGFTNVPLVCVEGQPSVAALVLLRSFIAAGADVRYHGDFDAGGLQAADTVLREGGRPWRYGVVDYVAARELAPDLAPGLRAQPASTRDPDLAAAIAEAGVPVPEERLVGVLLADLEKEAGQQRS